MVGEPEEINIQKLKNEYPDFFKKTPSKLVEFSLSEKISSQIAEICVKNGIEDEEKIEGVACRIVWALLGKLPKRNLSLTLEKGLGLDLETAKKISDETNKLIFSQIDLSEKKETIKEGVEEKSPRPHKKDFYRESIE
jgi:hypothetical protein